MSVAATVTVMLTTAAPCHDASEIRSPYPDRSRFHVRAGGIAATADGGCVLATAIQAIGPASHTTRSTAATADTTAPTEPRSLRVRPCVAPGWLGRASPAWGSRRSLDQALDPHLTAGRSSRPSR